MSLTVTSASTSYNLTTLARVKSELLIDQFDITNDDILISLIKEASDMLAMETGRTFAKQAYKETISGNNQNVLMLRKIPVVALDTIVHYCNTSSAGTTLTTASYNIKDKDAGFVYRKCGWLSSYSFLSHQPHLTVGVEPFPVDRLDNYEFSYTAGWVLPSTTSTAARTLPYDIERAALTLVAAGYYSLGDNPLVKTEKIGDAMQTKFDVPYGVKVLTGMPNSVYRMIERYIVTV